MLLGVIVGSAFVSRPDLEVILGTLMTTSLALGVSSGVSVYEAEVLERERHIREMEDAMLTDLEGTRFEQSVRNVAIIVASINFSTPLLSCVVYIFPFLFSSLEMIGIRTAAWIAISTVLLSLLLVGTYMGRNGRRNAILTGVKMLALGGATFLLGYFIETLI